MFVIAINIDFKNQLSCWKISGKNRLWLIVYESHVLPRTGVTQAWIGGVGPPLVAFFALQITGNHGSGRRQYAWAPISLNFNSDLLNCWLSAKCIAFIWAAVNRNPAVAMIPYSAYIKLTGSETDPKVVQGNDCRTYGHFCGVILGCTPF